VLVAIREVEHLTAPFEGVASQVGKKVLREMGLTDYETRAYLALLERGVLTASQISEEANVPYSKVYETLTSLERKGWIEMERGRPGRYYPKAPSDALATARMQLEEKLKDWERTIFSELQPFFEKREIREKPDIWILRGEISTVAKLREMLDNVKSELMVAAPTLPKALVDLVVPFLQRLKTTNVKILFMIPKQNTSWNIAELEKIGEVRVRDQMFGGGVIADGKEAILFLGEEKQTLVIWSNHIGLIQFAKDYFQYLWDSSVRPDISSS
jgi:sugar-specific transcriptional regulator TrmB